jgi:bifunctional DNA-binding transcriptional regulator/antitoxin component of YhaV-PrlF toxin-antitoxin module
MTDSKTHTSEVVESGGELFLPLPQRVLQTLNLKAGDSLAFREHQSADGFLLTRADSELKKVMKIADLIMNEERETLAKLAKS